MDAHLGTSNPRVWAAGDVTGHPQLTHLAGAHGSVAATNAVLGTRRRAETSVVPRVTFTDPEVAAVGTPTWEGDGAEGETAATPRTTTRQHVDVDRARAENRSEGFTRLALGPHDRIVGGTVVGPRAGESLAEITLAVRHHLTVSDLAGTIHPYPTYADGVWGAALAVVQERIGDGLLRDTLEGVIRVRRGLSRLRPA